MRRRFFERASPGAPVCCCSLAACAASTKSSGTPADSAKQAVTDTTGRLAGTWQLVEFQPAQPLEPMLGALLAAQMNQLVVTFSPGTMLVQGVGLNAERGYQRHLGGGRRLLG